MSMLYWVIAGVGIDADKVRPYLNKDRLLNLLVEQLPYDDDIFDLVQTRERTRQCPEFDIGDYIHGYPFDNLAELLTYCDDTRSITYAVDGDGGCYFYYPPRMPWELQDEDPKTVDEVHHRIVASVKRVTDLSESEVERMIDDDLYVVGAG